MNTGVKAKILVSIVLAIFIFDSYSYGQFNKIKGTYLEGDEYFFAEDYQEAIYYYLQILDKGYTNANIQYKIGVCYLNIPGSETNAIPYLEEAAKHISKKYKTKDITEHQAPLHTLFYLGNAYRIDNQLDKALTVYDKFINSPGYDGKYNLDIVESEIKACEIAKIIQDSPVELNWSHFKEPINTSSSETYPVISGDETVLVFQRALKFYNAIFYSRKIDGKWTEPENINAQVLSDGEYYPTCLSHLGNELYLVKKKKTDQDLYVSYYVNGKWTPARTLNQNINTPKNESGACINKDGSILYFSSNRKESRGGYDIFKCERGPNNEWGKAVNLGKVINTKEDEIAPCIAGNDDVLYFCSKGHFNMGGFDIFYSELGKDKVWGTPMNVGYPINTTNDNIYFTILPNKKTAYISRIAKDGLGKEDIYKVEILSKPVLNTTEKK
jgi:tetratricopeptide (TPR) repeat protein